MQELPVWLDEAQYGALKRYAEEQGVCMEKALKDAFFNAVGDSYDHDLSGKFDSSIDLATMAFDVPLHTAQKKKTPTTSGLICFMEQVTGIGPA